MCWCVARLYAELCLGIPAVKTPHRATIVTILRNMVTSQPANLRAAAIVVSERGRNKRGYTETVTGGTRLVGASIMVILFRGYDCGAGVGESCGDTGHSTFNVVAISTFRGSNELMGV